jgi:hypothetical protein
MVNHGKPVFSHGKPVNELPELEALTSNDNSKFETEEEHQNWTLTEWQDWCLRIVRNQHIKNILK